MTAGSLIALIGAALALFGPLVLPFITVDEAEVAFSSYQVLTGQLSLVLALVTAAVVVILLKKRKQALGWVITLLSLAQIGLMFWTYADVWHLTPCVAAGLSGCDASTGGLVAQTLATLGWGLVVVVLASVVAVFGGLIAVSAHPEYERGRRYLRVMMSWQGTVLTEKVFFRPGLVTVGESDQALFQLAAGGLPLHTLLTPCGAERYALDVPVGLAGELTVGGEVREATHLRAVELGRGDTGVLHFDNDVELRFDFTGAESALLAGTSQRDGVGLAVSFSVVAAALLLLLTSALMAERHRDRRDAEEGLADRVRTPIEVVLEDSAVALELEPEEEQALDQDTSGQKEPEEQGKFGDLRQAPAKVSKVPRIDAELVRHMDVRKLGLADALSHPEALAGALGQVMAGDNGGLTIVLAAMNGDGAELDIGHGPGGMGFAGIGTGGARAGGMGRIHGLAAIDTGGGVGRRSGPGWMPRPKRVIRVDMDKGTSAGGCERGEVAKRVRHRAPALRACYEMQLQATSNLSGKVTVQWIVDVEGMVQGDKVVASSLGSDALADCVMRAIRRIRFQPPDGGFCVIQWSFAFVSG